MKRIAFFAILAGCCAALMIYGCSEKAGGTRFANVAPDTHISFGPAEDSVTFYRIQAFWYGSDVDGDVDYFEVATVKNLRSGDLPDTLNEEELCQWYDGLDWGVTTSKESTFVVFADSCCYGNPNPRDPHYAVSYWGVLIRSVDDRGARDCEPAALFFQATNLIPKATIRVPAYSYGAKTVPPRPFIRWTGSDLDGDQTQLQYKYLLLPDDEKRANGIPPLSMEGSGGPHKAPDVGLWSEWVPPDCTYVTDIDLSKYKIGSPGKDNVWLYISVKDEGGAFLPIELFTTYNQSTNIRQMIVLKTGAGVQVILEGESMGVVRTFDCRKQPEVPAIFVGTNIYMRFWGNEEPGEGRFVESYRYYFDEFNDPTSRWNFWTSVEPVRDPALSPQWRVRYPDRGRFAPTIGSHVFGVQLRDLNRDTTCAEFHFDVLPGPVGQEPNILLVDDDANRWWEASFIPDYEESEFAMWSEILDGYNWQEWDTGFEYRQETPVRLVGAATTVIWTVDMAQQINTDLLDLCANRGNYLQSYVKVGGNLIIIGHSPTFCTMYWPDRTPDPGGRADISDVDFFPRVEGQDTTFHFMWEIFGIRRAQLKFYPEPFYITGLKACGTWEDSGFVYVPLTEKDAVPKWPGYIPGAFLFTEFDEAADVDLIYGVEVIDDPRANPEDWERTLDCENIACVYKKGNPQTGWGSAAYINLPAWWLDHDQLRIVIRELLERFGEDPQY